MEQASGLDHRRYRRGRRRRDKLRLWLRVALSFVMLAIAAALSAGIVQVVERPLPPIRGMSDLVPPGADPLLAPAPVPESEDPAVSEGS